MEGKGKKPTTKGRGAFHFLTVAFYMLRRRSSSRKPSMQMQAVEKSGWRRLMCLVRPLHSPSLQSSAAPPLAIKPAAAKDSSRELALLPPPASPDIAPAPRVYEDGMSSRYMSAEDLRELEEGQSGCSGGGGHAAIVFEEVDWEESDSPNEIDVQAEEFIAKFYEEMRLQRAESIERYNIWLLQHQHQTGEEC